MKTLFIDIETVSEFSSYNYLSDEKKKLWEHKCSTFHKTEELTIEKISTLYEEKAAIYAEFGKIICISIGVEKLDHLQKKNTLLIKSFYGEDEKNILTEFLSLIEKKFNNPKVTQFCGHNIREFDIPYICRRAIINFLPLPNILQISSKKPWEVTHLYDTMEHWKFGDYKSYVSLSLLANLFNIQSPKEDLDGSQVSHVFWKVKDIERIRTYCQRDVITVVKIYFIWHQQSFPTEENIIIVN